MKYLACALFLAAAAFAATWAFLSQPDANLDIARSVACMKASRDGRPDDVRALVSKIKADRELAAAKTFLAAYESAVGLPVSAAEGKYDPVLLDFEIVRRAILDSPGYSKELDGRVKRMPLSAGKAVAYALLADKAAQGGDLDAYGKLMDGAYYLMLAFDPVASENEAFEIMDILAGREDGERLVRLAQRLFYSNELALRVYSYGKSPKIAAYFASKNADAEFKRQNRVLAQAMSRAAAMDGINGMTREEFERHMAYDAIKFNMTWAIKNWDAYKYPLLAYFSRIAGNEDFYDHYKKLSLSDTQMRDMRAGLFQYVEYAANAFAMAGDPEASAVLLRALPEGREKSLSVKRVIRSMLSAPGGLDIVLRENLL